MPLYKMEEAGTIVEMANDSDLYRDVVYASVTAPELVYVEVLLNNSPYDGVWIAPGASHSWWSNAGGKILPPNGLAPGEHMRITSTGRCVLRIDWVE